MEKRGLMERVRREYTGIIPQVFSITIFLKNKSIIQAWLAGHV
jgi:hypothetical protein